MVALTELAFLVQTNALKVKGYAQVIQHTSYVTLQENATYGGMYMTVLITSAKSRPAPGVNVPQKMSSQARQMKHAMMTSVAQAQTVPVMGSVTAYPSLLSHVVTVSRTWLRQT